MGFLIKLLAKLIPDKWITRLAGVGLMLYAGVGYLRLLAPDQLSMIPEMSFDRCYQTFGLGLAAFGIGVTNGILKTEAKTQTQLLQDQKMITISTASTRDALLVEQNKLIEKQTGNYEIRTPGTSD
jgi:hypothetical protein